MKSILLIGACGSGKTWTMLELIKQYDLNVRLKCDLIKFIINKENSIAVLGLYDGTTFQGSDRLSMAVMKSAQKFRKYQLDNNITVIAEGDRFTNSTFINTFKPTIIKINDDGELGRLKRKSSQTERHIKSIKTRVQNIETNYQVNNSSEALELIKNIIK